MELVQELASFSLSNSFNGGLSRPKRGATIHKFYAHEAYGQETHPLQVVPQPRKRRRLRWVCQYLFTFYCFCCNIKMMYTWFVHLVLFRVPRRRQLRRPPKRQGGGGMPPIFTSDASNMMLMLMSGSHASNDNEILMGIKPKHVKGH